MMKVKKKINKELDTYINRIKQNIDAEKILESQSVHKFAELVNGVQLLIIDEAQRVRNIGLNLKILVDAFPQLAIIATGSASFGLPIK